MTAENHADAGDLDTAERKDAAAVVVDVNGNRVEADEKKPALAGEPTEMTKLTIGDEISPEIFGNSDSNA